MPQPYPGQQWKHDWVPLSPAAAKNKAKKGPPPKGKHKGSVTHIVNTGKHAPTGETGGGSGGKPPNPALSQQTDAAIRRAAGRKTSRDAQTGPKAEKTIGQEPAKLTHPTVGHLIPTEENLSTEEQRQMIAQFAAVMAGNYKGLDVELSNMMFGVGDGDDGEDWVQVDAVIKDRSGKRVGMVSRTFNRYPDGTLAVEHSILKLDKDVQGQGFASAFNRRMEDWYRESGVSRIQLTANIDVGGYVWARHGYDWGDKESAANLLSGFKQAASGIKDARARAVAEDIVRRAGAEKFGSDGYPTPFELSQVGYVDGADTWPGKDFLLGSKWEGAKWLS